MDRVHLINERKKTSSAYAGWQDAIQLRDRIILEVGPDSQAYRRSVALVRTWHKRWSIESDAITCEAPPAVLAELDRAEAQASAWTPQEV